MMEWLDVWYLILFWIIICKKSSDDIFEGISKLDSLYKVSCFQVYKTIQVADEKQLLSSDNSNSLTNSNTIKDSAQYNVFRDTGKSN